MANMEKHYGNVKPVSFKSIYEKQLYNILSDLRLPLMTVIFFTTVYVLLMMILNGKTDGESVANYFFHTIITFTTIGYTEGYTDSITANRLVTSVFLMVAFPLVYFYGLAATVQVILQGEIKHKFRHWRMYSKMEHVKNHYIICGFNETSKEIMRSFVKRKIPFILIDPNESKRQEIIEFGTTFYVIAQPQRRDSLLGLFIEDSKGLITTFDDDTLDIAIIVTARLIMPDKENYFIFSTSTSEMDSEKMKLLGANEVIVPAVTTGRRITSYVLHPPSPAMSGFLDLVAYGEKSNVDIVEIRISEESEFAGKSIADSLFKDKTGTNIIATVDSKGDINTIPDRNTILATGTSIIVLGTPKQLEKVAAYSKGGTK
ncbi:TrkA-N domain protein [Denitrovibrio acetiphilus DSM 12809]|uniref:TrkA-N domain protein n=2 Tax=Denitrovibrio TaxID=117999 RepID=D4H8W9_DENA2|nr:TrkA-N domain protein [Denitrovibrio acetiphilus DSM 12809]